MAKDPKRNRTLLTKDFKEGYEKTLVLATFEDYSQIKKILAEQIAQIVKPYPEESRLRVIAELIEAMPDSLDLSNVKLVLEAVIAINCHRAFFYQELTEKQAEFFYDHCNEEHNKLVEALEYIQARYNKAFSIT